MNKILFIGLLVCLMPLAVSAADLVDVHCLSELDHGTQWSVAAANDKKDPSKAVISASKSINGSTVAPAFIFSAPILTDVGGFATDFRAFDDQNNEFELGGIGAELTLSSASGASSSPISVELYCYFGTNDTWSFTGFASSTSSVPLDCGGLQPPSPSEAEAEADRQASAFCGKLGRKSVRATAFNYSTNNCVWGGFLYHYASDHIYADARYRCE